MIDAEPFDTVGVKAMKTLDIPRNLVQLVSALASIAYIEVDTNNFLFDKGVILNWDALTLASTAFNSLLPISENICELTSCGSNAARFEILVFGIWLISLVCCGVYLAFWRNPKMLIKAVSEKVITKSTATYYSWVLVAVCIFYITHISGFDPEIMNVHVDGITKLRFVFYSQAILTPVFFTTAYDLLVLRRHVFFRQRRD